MDASPDAFAGLQELPEPARPSLDVGCFPLAGGESPEAAEVPVEPLAAPAHAGGDADAAAASAAPAKKKRGGKRGPLAAPVQPAARQATRFTRGVLAPAINPTKPRRFGEERCIDPTHTQLCTSCTAAPALEEEHAYMLLGADGKKNGEKRLRSLLVRTAEWKDEKQRDAVIQACTKDPRLEALARVFQGANCSELRKAHVLYLARVWRYKSDLWVKRSSKRGDGGSDGSESAGGSRKRPRAAEPVAAPLTDLAEEAEDAADAAAMLPLDWARVSPPSPPELLGGGGGGGGGPAAPVARKPAAAGGGSGSSPALLPPLDALMLPPAAMMLPAGVAAARLLSSAKRGRPPAESSPEGEEPPLALQRAPEGGAPVSAADVAEAVRATLLPLVGRCGLCLSGERARTAYAAAPVAGTAVGGGAEFISQRVLEETRLAGAGWQGLYDALQRSLAPQRAWASQVAASAAASAAPASRGAPASGAAHRRAPPRRPGATDGGAPAWSVLLGGELPMEGLVRQTLTLVGASAAFARRRDADARTHGGSDVETAWLDEIAQAHAAMLQLCTRVQALMGSLKLNSMAEFLEGATALLELMLAAARGCSDAWAARAQWLAAVLTARDRRKQQHESDAVAAAAASRPLLLLAFGSATYKPLQFVAAGGEQPAAGAISSS